MARLLKRQVSNCPRISFGQVGAGGEVASALLLGTDQVRHANALSAVAGGGRKVADAWVVDEEGLPPAIEDVAPWVAYPDAGKDAEIASARVVLVDAPVIVADDPVEGLHLGVQKDAFLEIDPATGAATPCAYAVMRVLDAKTGHGEFLDVRDVVAVGILEEENVGGLGDVATAVSQLDPGRHVETVGEDGGLVGLAVAVGILEYDDLVVGHLARLQLGIGPGTGHPKASAGIPSHVNGVGQHGLLGEEVHLVPRQQLEVGLLDLRVMVVHEGQVGVGEVALADTVRVLWPSAAVTATSK